MKKSHLYSLKSLKKIAYMLVITLLLASFAWISEQLTEIRIPKSHHPAELYSNQTRDDLKQCYLQSINGAQKSVLLIIYTLTDPQIIQALKKKAEAGIDVQVLYDAKASPHLSRKLGSQIKTVKRVSSGLMHQKILVIDNDQIWIGSANLTGESLRMHGNLVTAMKSDALASHVINRAQTMPKEGKSPETPEKEFWLADQKVELWFLPDNPKALPRLLSLIQSAQKTIRIAMFTWTHPALAEAVIAAHQRGVDVEVVIDNHSGKGASAHVVQSLMKGGVSVNLSQRNGLLHHKFLLIDDELLINGSANWTKAAFNQNDDCFIILHPLTTDQIERLKALWQVIRHESQKPLLSILYLFKCPSQVEFSHPYFLC